MSNSQEGVDINNVYGIDPNAASSQPRNDNPIAPAGTHLARCYGVAFLGDVRSEYKGDVKYKVEIRLFFELVNELAKFGNQDKEMPFGLSYKFNYDVGPDADLAPFNYMILPWLGLRPSAKTKAEFRLNKMLGQYATVTVVRKPKKKSDGEFAVIENISPPMKGLELTPGVNEDYIYISRIHGTWSKEWLRLPQFIRKDVLGDSFNEYTDFQQIQANGCSVVTDENELKGSLKMMPAKDFLKAQMWDEEKTRRATAAAMKKTPAQETMPDPEDSFDMADEDDDLPF